MSRSLENAVEGRTVEEEIQDPQAYRKRAVHLRERAANAKSLESKRLFLSAADGYDHLADVLEEMAGRKPPIH
jgi:hypothetical protein